MILEEQNFKGEFFELVLGFLNWFHMIKFKSTNNSISSGKKKDPCSPWHSVATDTQILALNTPIQILMEDKLMGDHVFDLNTVATLKSMVGIGWLFPNTLAKVGGHHISSSSSL